MNSNSILSLKNYEVKEINFKANPNFASEKYATTINPEFSKIIKKINKDDFTVSLRVSITENAENKNLPYFVNTEIACTFNLEDWEKDIYKSIVEVNTVAIMFPYLRSLLTSVTSNTQSKPYVLPIMNINCLFQD